MASNADKTWVSPAAYKDQNALSKVDLPLVLHALGDRIGYAPAIAKLYNTVR